jgi:hypothetical protein
MERIFAQELGRIGGDGLGPFANVSGGAEGLTSITRLVSAIVGFMTISGFIWFIFQFLIGGFNWITSGGDKAKLQSSRDRITNALIGLIVVVVSWSILSLAGQFFGVDFTLSNPGGVMDSLSQ